MKNRSMLPLFLLLGSCSAFELPSAATKLRTWTRSTTVQRDAVSVLLSSLLVLSPVGSALAAVDNKVASPQWTNEYSDPLHPMCQRSIQLLDKHHFRYSGTAVGPKDDAILRGCTQSEIRQYGLRRGSFEGIILDDGTRISAGDGVHEGVWEPANSVTTHLGFEDVDGIRWNDGNKWIVKPKSTAKAVGEVIFWSYLGLSTLAGIKGTWDGIQRKRQAAKSR